MRTKEFFYYTAIEAYVNESVTSSRVGYLFGLPPAAWRNLVNAYHATEKHFNQPVLLSEIKKTRMNTLDLRVQHWWEQVRQIIESV